MTYDHPRLCIIYKISSTSPEDENFYVGSTLKTLNARINQHKKNVAAGKTFKLYEHIRINGGWDNFRAAIVEQKLVASYQEKLHYEQEQIDLLEPTLNTIRCVNTLEDHKRTKRIYYEKNKEEILRKTKQYAEDNREHLKQKSKEYRVKNKEVLKAKKKIYNAEHKEESKARHAKWKANNIQHLKEYKKQYYLKNKARISEKGKKNYTNGKKAKMLAKVQCECGATVTASYLKKHKRSDKHKRLLKASE